LSFGLASALSVVVLGDESGYVATQHQQMKIAAMEGLWKTEPAPASFNLVGWPDEKTHSTHFTFKIPYLLGLITTRSIDKPVLGIEDLVAKAKQEIPLGIKAYRALQLLQQDPNNQAAQVEMQLYQKYLGYALLLKKYVNDPTVATSAQINQAAWDTVPGQLATLFWSFRLMVACGFFFIFLFSVGFYFSAKRNFTKAWFLKLAFWSLPLPWLAAELGWYVAEHGRQPWVVDSILPTFMGVSSLSSHQVITSVLGFIAVYSILALIEVYLMVKYIRLGPEGGHNAKL
jgi:cytochrome d ubiquinol oxidase subunit I